MEGDNQLTITQKHLQNHKYFNKFTRIIEQYQYNYHGILCISATYAYACLEIKAERIKHW